MLCMSHSCAGWVPGRQCMCAACSRHAKRMELAATSACVSQAQRTCLESPVMKPPGRADTRSEAGEGGPTGDVALGRGPLERGALAPEPRDRLAHAQRRVVALLHRVHVWQRRAVLPQRRSHDRVRAHLRGLRRVSVPARPGGQRDRVRLLQPCFGHLLWNCAVHQPPHWCSWAVSGAPRSCTWGASWGSPPAGWRPRGWPRRPP